ncbi:MAG: hypothetical protein AB1724_12930 [Thermodesulfobacteriota bacterium]
MKTKSIVCVLSFLVTLYILTGTSHRITPDKNEDAHKILNTEQKIEKPSLSHLSPDASKPEQMVVVQTLPAALAAAIAVSEKAPKIKAAPPLQEPPVPPKAVSTPPMPKPVPHSSTPEPPVSQSKKKLAVQNNSAMQMEQQPKPANLAPKTISINQEQSAIGSRLQKEGKKLPIIEANWSSIGFDEYLKMIKQIGGHLFVGDTMNQSILAEVELHYYNSHYRFLKFQEPGELSQLALFRPREIADEPLVTEILSTAFEKWPDSPNLALVVLLPSRIETGFLGSLKQYLESNDYGMESFDIVRGEYFISGDDLGLNIKTAVNRTTNQVVSLGLKVLI